MCVCVYVCVCVCLHVSSDSMILPEELNFHV